MERSRVPDLDIIAGAYFPYAAEPAPARPSVPALPFQTLPAQEGAPWPEPRTSHSLKGPSRRRTEPAPRRTAIPNRRRRRMTPAQPLPGEGRHRAESGEPVADEVLLADRLSINDDDEVQPPRVAVQPAPPSPDASQPIRTRRSGSLSRRTTSGRRRAPGCAAALPSRTSGASCSSRSSVAARSSSRGVRTWTSNAGTRSWGEPTHPPAWQASEIPSSGIAERHSIAGGWPGHVWGRLACGPAPTPALSAPTARQPRGRPRRPHRSGGGPSGAARAA